RSTAAKSRCRTVGAIERSADLSLGRKVSLPLHRSLYARLRDLPQLSRQRSNYQHYFGASPWLAVHSERGTDLRGALRHAAQPPVVSARPKAAIDGEAYSVIAYGQPHGFGSERQANAQSRRVRVSHRIRDRLARNAEYHVTGMRVDRSRRSIDDE